MFETIAAAEGVVKGLLCHRFALAIDVNAAMAMAVDFAVAADLKNTGCRIGFDAGTCTGRQAAVAACAMARTAQDVADAPGSRFVGPGGKRREQRVGIGDRMEHGAQSLMCHRPQRGDNAREDLWTGGGGRRCVPRSRMRRGRGAVSYSFALVVLAENGCDTRRRLRRR